MPSTVIRSFDYDVDQQALRVTFQSGRRYTYRNVPIELYTAMKQAFAKGEFFNRYVRDRFEFIRDAS